MKKGVYHVGSGLLSLFFIGFLACKKTAPPKVVVTPLQTLINTDTSLTLFHRMILQANDAGLLNDQPVTVFIPRNSVLIQAGYPETIIDSMSSTLADRMIRYQFLSAPVSTDSAGYTPNPTLLGIPLYIGKDGSGNLLLNGSATAPNQSTAVGQASVYYLNSLIPNGADSLPQLLQADTTLSLFAQILARTNIYDSLMLSGGFSVLAPNNTAILAAGFDSLRIDTVAIDTLLPLAQNQVVKGTFFSTTFPSTLTTLTGGNITVSFSGSTPQFAGSGNPSPVLWLSGDQVAGAGLILHHVDGILSP
ncbi:MAG TPA: fasciclin domain-containing protein [Puia sp.]